MNYIKFSTVGKMPNTTYNYETQPRKNDYQILDKYHIINYHRRCLTLVKDHQDLSR